MPVNYFGTVAWLADSTTSASVTYTSGPYNTTTAGTVDVWQTWTTGTSTSGSTTQIWDTWQTFRPVAMTEEQRRRAMNDRRRHREQIEEHARQLQEAEEKAEELLLEHLTEEQQRDLAENRGFEIEGSRGRRYRICRGQVQNVLMLDRWGRPYLRLCAHPQRERVPDADAMLAQALMLQTDEDEFTRIANSQAA